MNQAQHGHRHSHHRDHGHGDGHPAHSKSGIHKDWRFWAVILMLAAMGMYVASENELIPFGGGAPQPMVEAE